MHLRRALVALIALVGSVGGLLAQVPALSSRPGAAYTIYLNFNGFNFSGVWGSGFGGTLSPGATPAYNSGTANFTTSVTSIWSRTAEQYAAFNVNVTTVDPAVAAGQAGSDAARQAYYDNQSQMMHTVVGGNGAWLGGGGGVSYRGVVGSAFPAGGTNGGAGAGIHTNFVFSDNNTFNAQPGWEKPAGINVAHENGHAFGLRHQSLWSGTTLQAEYDPGTATKGPVMGAPFDAQRALWRVGPTNISSTSIQNDLQVIQNLSNNPNIRPAGSPTGYVDSGIGHTRPTATPLPLTGNTINSTTARGVITPASSDSPNPLGEANYTTDFFRFTVPAGQTGNLNATLHPGRSTLVAGTPDYGATLAATFRLLDTNGTVLTAVNTASVTTSSAEQIQFGHRFAATITSNNLAAGDYYLQIASAGGDAAYFDIGSYFLTGTFTPVPEPATVFGVGGAVLAVGAVWRKRRKAAPAV